MSSSHKKTIIKHLFNHGEIDWVTAYRDYGIGGGWRARISDVREIFRRFKITLDSRPVKNETNNGEHFDYFLTKENLAMLKKHYIEIINQLENKKPLTLF